MAISQNFPDEGPSLALNFAQSKKLDPRVAFTRNSTATYLDENGLLATAPIDTPRFDHSYNGSTLESTGLLIEEPVVNYATYSEDSSNYSFIDNASITTNVGTAPDGTTTADRITSTINGGANTALVQKAFTVPVDSSRYIFSVFLKPGTSPLTTLNLQFAGGTYQQSVLTITWSTLSFSYTAGEMGTLVRYPNGWYRLSLSLANNGTNNTCYPRIYVRDQGSSNVNGHYVDAWGWQVEKAVNFSSSKYPTSYIPNLTTGSTTRATDYAYIFGDNFNRIFNRTEGTILSKARFNTSPLSGLQNRTTATLVGTGTGFLWQMWWETTFGGAWLQFNASTATYEVVIPLSEVRTISTYSESNSKAYKLISSYKVNDFAFCQDGGPVITDTSGALFTLDAFVIGDLNLNNQTNGTIEQILYYPKRLPNSQLQQLTR